MNLNLVSEQATQVVCQMLNSRAHVGRNRVLARRPVLRPDKIWNLHHPGHGVRENTEKRENCHENSLANRSLIRVT